MAIIKKVQIETNGVLNDIGAKYDEAENPIRGTYGASLDLPIETAATGGTSIQLVAKDNTVLSTVNLELDASVISDGILPVEFGGTGASSFTPNSIIMSGASSTAPLTIRPITDNIVNTAISNNNTSIPTMNTIYYGLATLNNTVSQNRGINFYAPVSNTGIVDGDVSVYNATTSSAEFRTLEKATVNTGYSLVSLVNNNPVPTNPVSASVDNGVLILENVSLQSEGTTSVATGSFTNGTVSASYEDANRRSW